MNSSQNKVPQPPKAASSRQQRSEDSSPPDSTLSPETIMDQHPSPETIMDQHPSSTVVTPVTPPVPLTPSAMSSTAPDQAEAAVTLTPPTGEPSVEDSSQDSQDSSKSAVLRQQPIPPASEPMQYRAIGLVRGKYVPSEEQFTRGNVITDDGAEVDAVLLGRVMSLVKKHIDLEQSHLWVVYPRTRENTEGLHVQIVGVWEPEKLNRSEESAPEEGVTAATATEVTAEAAAEGSEEPPNDTYFSVRGEVVFQSPDDQKLLVKIRRSPQQGSDESKVFKVSLQGALEGKVVGYFWDLQVERQGNNLIVQEGTRIGIVPPQKRSASDKGGRGGPRRGRPPRRGGFNGQRREGAGGQRPVRAGERSGSRDRPAVPSQPRPQFSKPVKRSKESQPES